MIEVSTLELLVKRIAPKMVLPLPVQPVARRVVQGYFLTISNLEAKDLRYRLEFRISLPDSPTGADAAARILEGGNTALIYDIAGANNTLALNRVGMTGRYISEEFTIPAQKTASVELLPNVAKFLAATDPLLEVRGFVLLSLPRDFSGSTPFEKLIGKPQLPQAKVLLNAEVRGTFLPNDFPSNPVSGDFDQINYSLALASGKALNLVPSDPSRILVPGSAVGIEVTSEIGSLPPAVEGSDSTNLVTMLAEMMSAGNGNGQGLEAVNRSFAELNLPLKMSAL